MQSYYLHQESSPPLAARNIQQFKMNEQHHYVACSRGKQLQIHKLLDGDLTFHGRFSFHAIIDKIEVLPSKHHAYDYLWVLDKKGRFCFWHPESTDLVDNTILWDYASEVGEEQAVVYSGVKAQFQGNNTQGNIFFTNGQLLVLIKFSITQHGVAFDRNNVIKYHLSGLQLRFAGWIHHSLSLFLVGLIIQEEGKTYLSVYDLQKGIGICKESQEWRLERNNLLHFVSQVSGQILITTYNEVSLHNYKNQNSLKSYRTRGNYGQGFYLADEGMYGHIGEELIAFNRDRLVSYGQVKGNYTSICFIDCKVLGKVGDGIALSVSHYEGDTYLLRIYPKSFTFYHIYTAIGPILEICTPKQSLFAVTSQTQNGFQVSLLQSQYRIPVKEQTKFQQRHAEQLITINGGIYLIISSQCSNQVFRLNRSQQYEEYFSLPQGNILAADGKFIVYDDAIYEIDYQSCMMTMLEQRELLLAQITGDFIYYLDYEGTLHSFDNNCEDQVSTVALTNRSADYCWGVIPKTNSLIAANLNQPKQITIIKDKTVKYASIKGHTLVSCLSSISYYKSRSESDNRIIVGYVDGQVHVQYLKNDYFHSTQVFTNYCSMPVSFILCGEDTVLVNYNTKQYLLTANKDELQFVNISFGRQGAARFMFGFLQKTSELCFVDSSDQGKQIIFKRIAASGLKNTIIRQKSKTLRITKLQEWVQSVPKLLNLDDRLAIASYNEITLINLQNSKQIRTYHHNLKEVISLSSIKMGILLCGVSKQNHSELFVLTQDLDFVCKFQLQEKKQVRYLKPLIQQNQFLLSHGDSVTLYKITDNRQLQNLLGSKLDLQAYHLDICDNTILINDPFRNISILQFKQSINCLGNYLPPYRITHASFIGSDIVTTDERGTISIVYTHVDQTLDFNFKFIKLTSFNIGDRITATYSTEDCLFYATETGQIGVIKAINRDEFDTLKKIQTQSLLENQQHPQFSYWQWRSRQPVHQRLIDSELFSQNSYFLSNYHS